MDIQTDTFLEELTDTVPEMNESTQTDAYMDRPMSPLFMPIKRGQDVATQIESGELFDFEAEVEPMLQVLVGKTLELSVMEVLEEEELKQIRYHQDTFEQTRNAEVAEIQRLEAEATRKSEEKARRIMEQRTKQKARMELEDKVAARSFAKHYLSDLHATVFTNLMETGHFYDPLLKEVQDQFLPSLIEGACNRVAQIGMVQTFADQMIQQALTN